VLDVNGSAQAQDGISIVAALDTSPAGTLAPCATQLFG
jgi:hypothetical protein